ncbi:FAD/NAD(P)-binding domain-containing protein [Xylariaceae sp. FL0594]|nr:FAD/NAD(P)-binding domain-containing protein [Xylariaceae sp. FL0594]
MAEFRVVIIGAGPAGLFTANALAAAGMDYLVLERQPEVVSYRGALILLWPPFVRLLDQLGILDSVMKHSTPFVTKTNFTHTGEILYTSRIFPFLGECLGYQPLGLSRRNLVSSLYESLSDRETKVRAGANVVSIDSLENGVRVHLEDGSVVEGSMVIAADGVHSLARGLVQRLSHASPASSDMQPTSPMVPNYVTVFGTTRYDRPDLGLGAFIEGHGPGIASQSARLADAVYFNVIKRLKEPPAERKRFTPDDLEKMVEELRDLPLFPGVKFEEIWSIREQTSAVLIHQEEGLAERWYHGRIVVVGDAVHKMTSITGQGAMIAVLSATKLVNLLRATLVEKPNPSSSELEAVFAQYEASCKGSAGAVVQKGIFVTSLVTWTGENAEALDRQLSASEDPDEGMKSRVIPVFESSPILDFIPFEGKHGTVPWKTNSSSPVRERL